MLLIKDTLNLAVYYFVLLTTMSASSSSSFSSSSSRTVNMKIFAGVADGSVVIFKRNQGKKEEIYDIANFGSKMNQTLRCDWLSEQQGGATLPSRDCPLCPARK